MEIKEVTNDDLDLLTQMNIKLREDEKIDNVMTDQQVYERMKLRLSTSYKGYLFKNGNFLYGYALIDHSRTPVYLCQIFIEKEVRSKGIGTESFHALIQYLNITEIDVEVLVWNEASQKYYNKIGFKPRYIGLRYKE